MFNEIQNSILYNSLSLQLKNAVNFIFTVKSVAYITGNEFQKDNVPLTKKVTEYYITQYPNGVYNNQLGIVKLDKEGVKDSLAHGMSSLKAAAYKAVPKVIEKGYIYDVQKNWKDRGYDTATILAPINIGKDVYICDIVVIIRSNKTSFYLHEVEQINKFANVFKTPTKGSTSANSKLIITHKIQNFNPIVK